MRIRAVVGSLLGGLALAALVATPALAEEPVDLGSSPVLDTTGQVDTAAVESAIDAAFDRTGVSLFVVVVDTFTSPTDADAWTTRTAERNGLGIDDVLLAIAVEDRTYSLSADYATLDDGQYDAVLTRIEDSLRDEDWTGAGVGAAQEIADQLDAPFPVVPVAIGGGVVALGGIIAGGVAIGRRRSANAASRASVKELDTRAGSLLVQLDDDVKTSEQELGFAVAQFGEAPTAGFREALDAAKAQVKEAFEIRHRLDDAQPESAEERRALTLRIIELCEAADDTLDAQDEAFDALRDLEANAPQLVESVGAEQAALAARIDAADAAVTDLRSRFGAPAVDAIDENPAQARKLASVAGTALDEARAALTAGEAGKAAVAVRTAQQSVFRVALICSTAASAAAQDPATALAAVEQINATLNTELAAVRDRQAQVDRAAAQLDRVTAEARASVDSAREYLTTRRGAVGASARARLAEAESQLTQALSLGAADPVAALTAAQNAARLSGSALSLARSEVASFDSPVRDLSYGSDDWGGGVLGGILDGLFSGSGSSGSSSGWSSSRRRSSSSGSWGGSSRRSSGSSRRSSSSGGRRSRGGRF